ncbi:MAG: fatty acid desaturase [Fischerella sp.]|jgi:fatty acid desaturase|uniref:fatty acid desaturase family protein n=1 Tax=Fischerella sp. TaxID=1191 RepID=UPI0017BEC350|nr:fatty acid desaturase [Fischerella sp.]NWF57800.1 fatty acid desaturase [Fischerella sp.]
MRILFKYSWWDSLPFAITIFQLVLNIWLAATWESRTFFDNLLFYPFCLFLFWYNALVPTHNFVHTPWFKSKFLNNIYAIINSANLVTPVAHYRYIHFNHHQYGNDRQNADGQTQDRSSTFAYGKNGRCENVITYCALAIFRDDMTESFRQAKKYNESLQLYLEFAAIILAIIGYLLLSWKFILFFFVPIFYLGWFIAYLTNYYEHFGATPENRYANSTSYYGHVYNLLFCNEGYHQEHHLRPEVHWSQRPKIYQNLCEKLDSVDRVVLKFPPSLGFMHHKGNTDTSVKQTLPY